MTEPPGVADLFAGLPIAVVIVDPADRVAHANAPAEELLNRSERALIGRPLAAVLPPLADERRDGQAVALYDVELATARGAVRVDLAEGAVPGHEGWRAVAVHPAASARGLGRPGGGRAAVGAAAMLAHEIRNPLAGIRGAAQLLDAGELTRLIITEVDRIAALIDRMQDFGDDRPLPVAAENIYPLLAHARGVARAGFAAGIAIEERYDPSLPPARVNRDALLQVVLNLVRNACEALRGAPSPRIVIATAYRPGMAVSAAAGRPRVPLPIEIRVEDNGPGAPVDIADNLFDPFVSGRAEGRGLGLALVDKLMRDMGGAAHYARDAASGTTTLRLLLPRAAA